MDMDIDKAIEEHYGRAGLEEAILAGLVSLGRDIDHIDPEDLAAVDELHVGGAEVVRDLARDLGIRKGSRVLDVGSGLGGPARLYAREFGARVEGIDLTPEFVTTATSLTRRSGLAGLAAFTRGSALDLPFPDAEFDAASMIHVGMNIRDKSAAFGSIARVMKPGAGFAVYDFMVVGDGAPEYPLPWSDTVDTSFPVSPEAYIALLTAAGFAIDKQESRLRYALEFAANTAEEDPSVGPSPLGLHLVLGPDVGARMKNITAAMTRGILAPVEILSHRA